jgi:glucose/arabinose dehydrogenase
MGNRGRSGRRSDSIARGVCRTDASKRARGYNRGMQRCSCFLLLALACSSKASSPPPSDSCAAVPASAMEAGWLADPHFCLYRFAEGITGARQMVAAPNGDLFVATPGQILGVFDSNGDGVSDTSERSTFSAVAGGNHAVALTATHLYASSETTVYRFPYATGDRVATGAAEIVVQGIGGGGHSSRTLLIDKANRLYVSIGSASNVDAPATPDTPSPARAVIRRYDLSAIPAGGHAAMAGELFAAGLRNEVGLTLDAQGRMWGVENGRDNLSVAGSDIHYDNPAEEVNLFDTSRPGRNYGYPFCWSEGLWTAATAKGPGTQHLDPDQPGAFTEGRCQDQNLVVPPAFALPAHLAPLDIVEYRGKGYPTEYAGNLFVTSHGSWNREIGQMGRTVIRLRMGAGGPTAAQDFVGQVGADGGLAQGMWGVRPVSIVIDGTGLLTFSDDGQGAIHKIGYRPTLTP